MNIAIILAAGQGWRLQAGTKKAFIKVSGKPLVQFALDAFDAAESIDKIVVVLPQGSLREFNKFNDHDVIKVTGGDTRFKSLKKAINALPKHFSKQKLAKSNLIIHNAANPLVTIEEIEKVTKTLEKSEAAGVATPLHDTLRKINRTNTETIPRENLWRMQTPQGLNYKTALKGLDLIKDNPTDDLQLAEIQGIKPKIIPAASQNFKVTTDEELKLMEDVIWSHREFTAGLGEDAHAFSNKGKLVLGGITIPKHPKLEANSDGDVMIHSLITALLQAMGAGSLGEFADPMMEKGHTDSKYYLSRILDILEEGNWMIQRVEFMIEGIRPRIDKLSLKLKKSIAKLCGIEPFHVSIAAHTGEELSPFGQGEGLKCLCLVTLERLCLD